MNNITIINTFNKNKSNIVKITHNIDKSWQLLQTDFEIWTIVENTNSGKLYIFYLLLLLGTSVLSLKSVLS